MLELGTSTGRTDTHGGLGCNVACSLSFNYCLAFHRPCHRPVHSTGVLLPINIRYMLHRNLRYRSMPGVLGTIKENAQAPRGDTRTAVRNPSRLDQLALPWASPAW